MCSVLTAPSLQTEKFDELECTISTVGETCVVSCAIGYELAFSERSRVSARTRALPAQLGSLPACQVTRCSTSTNPVSTGVSKVGENITHGASCQAACAVGFESANHTELSWQGNSVPSCPVCGEKKCVDVALIRLMLAPDCMNWTLW